MQKRRFLKLLASSFLAYPFQLFADWNKKAFWESKQDNAINLLFPDQTIIVTDKISLGVNSKIENGAVVPIKIRADLPDVTSISIFVEKNPNPLICHYKLSSKSKPFIACRMKVEYPSNITAIVESEDKVYSNSTFIEVAEGGC